jgi:hypothetical protein
VFANESSDKFSNISSGFVSLADFDDDGRLGGMHAPCPSIVVIRCVVNRRY